MLQSPKHTSNIPVFDAKNQNFIFPFVDLSAIALPQRDVKSLGYDTTFQDPHKKHDTCQVNERI